MAESTASGQYSTGLGKSIASEKYSTAMGASRATGDYSTAIGASSASGEYSTAMGYSTASGSYSTAIGNKLNTNSQEGSFLIGDSYFGSSELFAAAANRFYGRFRNGYVLYTNAANSMGVSIGANGNAWASLSDSTKKENFLLANAQEVLKGFEVMRVGTWNYKGQDAKIYRHWGVMAQDFYTYFGKDSYGTIGNDTTIATADMDGVLFAGIKALLEKVRKLEKENEGLKKLNDSLFSELSNEKEKREKFEKEIYRRVAALEKIQ